MEKEQDWNYSPCISGSEYYSPERRSEIREGARKLRRQYLRYKVFDGKNGGNTNGLER